MFHDLICFSRQTVNDMLQIAKLYTSTAKYCNGLGFGEFCVLAADFRKFR